MDKNTANVTIPLTDEQRLLIRQRLGVDISEWEVDFTVPAFRKGYAGTHPDRPWGRAVELNDHQRELIRHETGRECDFIEIDNRPLPKYAGPPPKNLR